MQNERVQIILHLWKHFLISTTELTNLNVPFSQGDLSSDNIFFAVKTTKKYHKDRGIPDKYSKILIIGRCPPSPQNMFPKS